MIHKNKLGVIPSISQELLSTICLGVTSNGELETICDATDHNGYFYVQGQLPNIYTTFLSLKLNLLSQY